MSTPLYDALTHFAAQNPLRMAMPGHKGKPIPGLPAEYARLDFTAAAPTGNLYGEESDCIAQAEQAWAEAWGADSCLFLIRRFHPGRPHHAPTQRQRYRLDRPGQPP